MNARTHLFAAPLVNAEAERLVLGALLFDMGAFDRIADKLKPEHFAVAEHRAVYAEIQAQAMACKAFDVLTVADAMRQPGIGLDFLTAIMHSISSAANVRRHAQIVIGAAKSRALASTAHDIAVIAEGNEDADEKLEAAQQALGRLVEDSPRDDWVSAFDGMLQHTDVLTDRADGKIRAWPTGLVDLDNQLEGGLRPGELIIIGARPSMGKTALALSIGVNMALSFSVGLLSMEMPQTEVNDRLVALLGRVSLSHVKRPGADKNSPIWDAITTGAERAKAMNLYVSDQVGLTINQVRLKARNLKRLHGLDVLMIDYIGLMTGSDSKLSRAYQLEEISRGLKNLAKELQICVVCLAQLNRDVEKRIDPMPNLSDLRDSGAIEQDADVVIFITRPIQAKPDLGEEFKNFAKASIAKNRNGPCGVISLHYLGEQTRFSNWFGAPPNKATPKRNARDFE